MKSIRPLLQTGAAFALAVLLSNCASTEIQSEPYMLGMLDSRPVDPAARDFHIVGQVAPYWDGGDYDGPVQIVVDLQKQGAFFYKGDHLVGTSPISSGKEGRNTRGGNFKIMEKDEDHTSSAYGSVVEIGTGRTINHDATPSSPVPPGCRYEPSPMYFFMRLTSDGVGMHQGFLPGYPASHGCIRMDAEMAKKFYQNVQIGTPVRVVM